MGTNRTHARGAPPGRAPAARGRTQASHDSARRRRRASDRTRRQPAQGQLADCGGRAGDAYGRVSDGLAGRVDRAPADYQDTARKGLGFARGKPLLPTGIVAGLAVLLGALGRRR